MQTPSRVLFAVWITLAALTAGTPLKGQDYTLRSMEGKKTRVHVAELHRELRVSCLHDTLLLHDYFGGYSARVLDSSFLQITYAVRGGSGFGPENTAILAVGDGRLHQTLLLMSSFETVGSEYEHTLHTTFQLASHHRSDWHLTLNAREYIKDKSHPAGLRKNLPPVLLPFNKELMAFCNKTVIADSPFTALEYNQNIEYIRFAAGDTLMTVQLADDTYYYSEGLWYSPTSLMMQHDTVVDKLFRLPDVRQRTAWIDSVTHRRHGISLMMLEMTDWPSDTGHYVLQAGFHSRQKFDAYWLYKVYQPRLEIKTEPVAHP